MTDSSFEALAAAGCGKNLTSLTFRSECLSLSLSLLVAALVSPLGCALRVFSDTQREENNAGLHKGVTDSSFQALAAAGCGESLTSLYVECE